MTILPQSFPSGSTLDCQDCGKILRELSPGEQQAVARNPEKFIVYCLECARARREEMR